MERVTNALYQDYDERRTLAEAQEADEEDEADLRALEDTIKRRRKP
jgi:hypothetical protein